MRFSETLTHEEWLALQDGEARPGHRVGIAEALVRKVLSSNGVSVYTVRKHADGSWSCKDEAADAVCRGFHYRGFCRHIGRVQQEMRDG